MAMTATVARTGVASGAGIALAVGRHDWPTPPLVVGRTSAARTGALRRPRTGGQMARTANEPHNSACGRLGWSPTGVGAAVVGG
jgi:hypothetical protein